jgi:putative Holliday junction resolvase
MARILAFDYGMKRVGVAVTDPLQIIANSVDTIATKEIEAFIKQYVAKEDVIEFVVGMPYNFGHTQNELVAKVDGFIALLRRQYPEKRVTTVDERFTSRMASRVIAESGKTKKEREKKGNIDKISATIILQSFLEMRDNGLIGRI